MFPLIQLPRKSEDSDHFPLIGHVTLVSINSTSEEVRSGRGLWLLLVLLRVSINSTSEEVRSEEAKALSMKKGVSINSTSEEVRRLFFENSNINYLWFPLIQLPRKSEGASAQDEFTVTVTGFH